jgi:regulator of chromosome condensation
MKGAPRINTTPVTAKNIRHRSASSSSLTKTANKKSTVPTKATTSKRKTAKTTDGLFFFYFFFKIQSQIILVQPSRSKSSMARPTRRTIHRKTTYLSVPSIVNGNSKGGQVLAVGENGMTQLGLKSSIDQRKNPQPVLIPELILQIAAGPLHSVCLTNQNNIYTFGCNDEHALGRPDNNNDDDDTDPFGEVNLSKVMNIDEENIVQIVAGDSHTLVLSNIGKVYGRFYQ